MSSELSRRYLLNMLKQISVIQFNKPTIWFVLVEIYKLIKLIRLYQCLIFTITWLITKHSFLNYFGPLLCCSLHNFVCNAIFYCSERCQKGSKSPDLSLLEEMFNFSIYFISTTVIMTIRWIRLSYPGYTLRNSICLLLWESGSFWRNFRVIQLIYLVLFSLVWTYFL